MKAEPGGVGGPSEAEEADEDMEAERWRGWRAFAMGMGTEWGGLTERVLVFDMVRVERELMPILAFYMSPSRVAQSDGDSAPRQRSFGFFVRLSSIPSFLF